MKRDEQGGKAGGARATRMSLIVVGLALCAMPAQGADPTPAELHAMTPIDELPSKDEITQLFVDPIPRLRELALTQTVDFGVQLRAVRSLPQFCTPTCKQIGNDPPHPARAAVLEVIARIPDRDRSGRDILKLRASIEALGLTRSGAQSDVDLLVQFLNFQPSRDVRAAAAHALRTLCHPAGVEPLRDRHDIEGSAQVRLAISSALDALDTCTPP